MTRPLRLSFENAVYHVMARGNRKDNIFYSESDRNTFLDQINETFTKYSIVCYAYCLLNNHYHLFIKTRLPNISRAMHDMNASYANWFKAKHGIVGVVFQGRYKSILVEENRYALQLSTYIHLNPIRAGLVRSLHQYPWSSYLDYVGARKPSVAQLEPSLVLGLVTDCVELALCPNLGDTTGRLQTAQKKYEIYVAAMANMKNPLKEAHRGMILGGSTFIENMQKRIASSGVCREIPETRVRPPRCLTPEDFVNIMTATLGITKDTIFARCRVQRRNPYFPVLLYLLKKTTPMSLQEIGDFVGLDYAAVHQAVRRFELKLRYDPAALAIKDKTENAVMRWTRDGMKG